MITLMKIEDNISILETDIDYSNTDGYAVVESLPNEPQETWDIVGTKLVIDENKMRNYTVQFKENKKMEIENIKASLEFADFTFEGITIQADEKSQSNLTSATLSLIATGQNDLTWITADNQIISIPKDKIIAMGTALKERNTVIVVRARILKDALEKAETLDEIKQIKWEE